MPEHKYTNRAEVITWKTVAGSFGEPFEIVAWKITVYPGLIPGSDFVINSAALTLAASQSTAPFAVGGAYVDGRPINTLFRGTYVSEGSTMVIVEYMDPDLARP